LILGGLPALALLAIIVLLLLRNGAPPPATSELQLEVGKLADENLASAKIVISDREIKMWGGRISAASIGTGSWEVSVDHPPKLSSHYRASITESIRIPLPSGVSGARITVTDNDTDKLLYDQVALRELWDISLRAYRMTIPTPAYQEKTLQIWEQLIDSKEDEDAARASLEELLENLDSEAEKSRETRWFEMASDQLEEVRSAASNMDEFLAAADAIDQEEFLDRELELMSAVQRLDRCRPPGAPPLMTRLVKVSILHEQAKFRRISQAISEIESSRKEVEGLVRIAKTRGSVSEEQGRQLRSGINRFWSVLAENNIKSLDDDVAFINEATEIAEEIAAGRAIPTATPTVTPVPTPTSRPIPESQRQTPAAQRQATRRPTPRPTRTRTIQDEFRDLETELLLQTGEPDRRTVQRMKTLAVRGLNESLQEDERFYPSLYEGYFGCRDLPELKNPRRLPEYMVRLENVARRLGDFQRIYRDFNSGERERVRKIMTLVEDCMKLSVDAMWRETEVPGDPQKQSFLRIDLKNDGFWRTIQQLESDDFIDFGEIRTKAPSDAILSVAPTHTRPVVPSHTPMTVSPVIEPPKPTGTAPEPTAPPPPESHIETGQGVLQSASITGLFISKYVYSFTIVFDSPVRENVMHAEIELFEDSEFKPIYSRRETPCDINDDRFLNFKIKVENKSNKETLGRAIRKDKGDLSFKVKIWFMGDQRSFPLEIALK
jgi:hypothetical protein